MTVLFRFTIYQANGTTPDLTVTSQRGGSNPYIVDVPSGDGQEVDLLTGAVRSGAYVVTVADIVTGTDGTGTVRLITNKLEDNQFRQQLLSRRAKLECSRDGGSTYAIWTLGYLTGIQQVDAITYSFTVSDSRRIESTHTIFTWSSDPLAATDERREFPNRGCLVGGPTIQNFGPIRASGGWEFAWREVQSGYLALAFVAAYDPPSYARTVTPPLAKIKAAMQRFYERQPPIADLTGDNYKQIRERQFVNAYPSVLAIVESGASVWYGTVRGMFTPPGYTLTGLGQVQIPPFGDQNYLFVQLTPGQSTSYPSTNAKVRVRLVSQEVAPESALYIDEHPVDIVSKLYETVNIPFNAASVTSTKAAVGTDVRLALRITEPVNMGEFLSSSIFGPFGFSVRTNAAGEQEFFPTRISNSATPTITIANADIVGDTPPAIYDLDEGTVVTGFRLTSTSFSVFDQDPELRDPPPPDGLTAQGVTIAAQNADTSTYSTKEVKYEIPGMIHDGSASNGAFAFSPEVVQRFFTGIVAEGFDRFGRGAVASEVQVIASSSAANLQVGDEVNIAASYYPNKNYRIGESNVGNRIAQIVRRTETPEGPSYKLVDSGVSAQPTAPTFTLAAWPGEPRRIATATVTNAATLNSSNVTLAVQYQISATTPTTRTGTLFTRFRPGTIPTIAFTLPVVPPGSRVYVRMRTEKTELRASAWTAWAYVDLGAWVAPNSLTTSNVTADAVTFTIGLGSPTPNTLDPLDIFAYPGASAPADWTAFRIGTLSAGSTSTIVRDLTPSTQYTFGVAFRDEGTGAYSGFATATVTTAALNTVSAPAAPKMKLYTSFPNAGQTTGIALTIGAVEGYNIVVQRAPNVSGAPGTFADLDTLPPLTSTYVDVLPSDGITRWYRVFYRLSGFLDGTPGTARSGTPIGIPDDFLSNTQATSIAGQATLTLGNYLTGGSYDGSASVTTNVDATPNNTASKVVARDASGNFSAGTVTAALAGNATTATTLQTARNINGVAFNGSADITVTAAAGTLTGTTLASGVTASSLTSVGTIATGVWQGTSIGKDYGGTGLTSTAFTGITNERIFVYDGGSGVFEVGPTGSNGQGLIYSGGALAWGNPAPGLHVLATTTALGPEHSVSGLTSGMILQATGATTARFQTPSIPASSVTAGTFGGVSYTITNDLTVSGTLTATLTGNASTATALQTARTINGVSFDGTANITVAAAAGTLTGSTLASGVTASSLTSVGTLTGLTVSSATQLFNTGNAVGTLTLGTTAAGVVSGEQRFRLTNSVATGGVELVLNSAATSWGLYDRTASKWAIQVARGATDAVSILGSLVVTSALSTSSTFSASSYAAVGGAVSANAQLYVRGTMVGTGVNQYSALVQATFPVAATSGMHGVYVATIGAAGTYTTTNVIGVNVQPHTLGAGQTVTDAYGVFIGASSHAATAKYGIQIGSVTGGTTNYAIYTNAGLVRFGGAVSVVGNVNLSSGSAFQINSTNVLTATALGTGVTASSLTSVGTIGTGVWQGTAIGTSYGGTGTTSYGASGTGTRAIVYDIVSGAFEAVAAGTAGQFLQSAGSSGDILWATPPNFSTTTTTAGYVPGSNNVGATYFLNANGVWAVPAVGSVSANNVTAGTFAGATYTFSNSVTFTSGVRVAFGETYKILNSGGTAIDVLSATTLGTGVVNSSLTSVGTLTSGALGAGFTAIANARLANSAITINGTSVSLGGSITVSNQTITLSGDVTGSGATSIVTTLANSGVTAGTYGGNNAIPRITVDAKGRITGISTITPSGTWSINVSGSAASAPLLSAVGTYTFYASTNGRSFNAGIQAGFVDFGTNGYPNYGSVVRINTYPNDGGSAELYFPYSAIYGGSAMRYRLGLYDNAGWTGWKTVLDDGNFSSYALPLSGGTLTGNLTVNGYVIFKDSVNTNTYGIRGLSGIITADGGAQYPTGWNFQYGGSSNSALYINSSGNVGIGTTSPGYRLDIVGGSATALRISGNSSATNNTAMRFYGLNAAADLWAIGNAVATNDATRNFDIYDLVAGANRIRIDSSGNVGIGTTSPANLLHVKASGNYGTIISDNSTTTGGGAFGVRKNGSPIGYLLNRGSWFGNTTDDLCLSAETGYNIRFYTNGSITERFIINTSGYVGIGETSPVFPLSVAGTIQSIGAGTDTPAGGPASIYLGNGTAGTMLRHTANRGFAIDTYSSASVWGERLRITRDGDVGIGTTAPGYTLDVNGTFAFRSTGYVYNAVLYAYRSASNTYLAFTTDATGGKVAMYQGAAPLQLQSEGGNTLVAVQNGWAGSRLQVGTSSTSVPAAEFNGTGNSNGLAPVYVWNNAESGITYHISFYTDGINNARALRGYLAYRRATAEMFLYSASDYRIKQLHGTYAGSGDIIDRINVYDASIIGEDGERGPMVLAHEIQEVYPRAVEGEKDAVNEDGTPKLQMVGYNAMIPLMLAEIKSLRERVAQLENR